MELYGYKKFGDPNYFPIYTDKNYIATTTDTLERTQEKMLKNMSAAQETVKHTHSGRCSFLKYKMYFIPPVPES